MNMRRATLVATGLAMTASIGLAGAGMASAAAPKLVAGANASAVKSGLKLSPGPWTVEVKGGSCEIITITSSGTFSTTEFGGDSGYWAGGKSNLALSWTAGNDTGLLFSGAYVSSPVSYKGSFGGIGFGDKGKLVQGSVAGC